MMPLSKTNELNLIMNENAKLTVEHSGGDGWTILHGDMLNLMRSFESGVFDAVITDPPYASGGASQTAKNRTTNQKYSSMSPDKALPDFAGDQKDQRSWTNWCTEWLTEANRVCKPGAVLVVFCSSTGVWRLAFRMRSSEPTGSGAGRSCGTNRPAVRSEVASGSRVNSPCGRPRGRFLWTGPWGVCPVSSVTPIRPTASM